MSLLLARLLALDWFRQQAARISFLNPGSCCLIITRAVSVQ
jgi:hypothetical protein